uniref:Uncharacterized protein n=1 Tax=Lepeophtheirus salmonis TaxID=72036 RepID=A0A0K2U0D4_LEPSM
MTSKLFPLWRTLRRSIKKRRENKTRERESERFIPAWSAYQPKKGSPKSKERGEALHFPAETAQFLSSLLSSKSLPCVFLVLMDQRIC